MSEMIEVGDLVVVVRGVPCCGAHGGAIGKIYKVAEIRPLYNYSFVVWCCKDCQQDVGKDTILALDERRKGFNILQLKKIPPLSEPSEERREEYA